MATKPTIVSLIQTITDLSQRALAIAVVNDGQVFPGMNVVDGCGMRVNISTLNKLERRGHVTHKLSTEGGAMFVLTDLGRSHIVDPRVTLTALRASWAGVDVSHQDIASMRREVAS